MAAPQQMLLSQKIAAGGGGDAFTFESSATGTSDTWDITVDKPTGTASGDLLVACVMINGSAQPDNMSGGATWNALAQHFAGSPASGYTRVFWKIAGGSEPSTYTVGTTDSNGEKTVAVLRYSLAASAALNIDGTKGELTTTEADPTIAAPTITTTVNGCMLINMSCLSMAAGVAGCDISAPSGYTRRAIIHSNNRAWLAVSDAIQSTAGATGTVNAASDTGAGTAGWLARMAAFEPA